MPDPTATPATLTPTAHSDVLTALDTLRTHLPQVFATITKQINVAQVTAQSGTVDQISVGQVTVGNVVVGSMKLVNTSATLHSGNAFLENVAMNLELKFGLHWWYDIGIWSDSGDSDLGSLWFSMTIGNVAIPSLGSIQMSIPSVAVSNVTATMPPISNINLGAAGLSNLKINTMTMPTPGFTLNGMTMGTFKLSDMGMPAMTAQQVSIDDFKPSQTVVLPSATIGGVTVPSTSVPDVKSGHFNLDAVTATRSLVVDFGVFGFTLSVTPIAHMQIGSMTMSALNLSAAVGGVTIENVSIPVDVHSILLKTLKLTNLNVTDVSA